MFLMLINEYFHQIFFDNFKKILLFIYFCLFIKVEIYFLRKKIKIKK